jgi:glyoxylase-like metal-dependent hydrolase (beta-lactamase superfamily II)
MAVEGFARSARPARRRLLHALPGLLGLAAGSSLLAGCAGGPGAPGAGTAAASTPMAVAPGVYVLRGAQGEIGPDNRGRIANLAFIVGPKGVLAINSGVSHRQGLAMLAAIRSVTALPVRQLLLTHVRQEFLFGTSAFVEQGIPVLMHPAAARLMAARCETCLKSLVRALGAEEMQGSQVPKAPLTFDPALGSGSGRLADIGRPLQLLSAGPGGHSSGPGDLALLDDTTATLVAGGWIDARSIPDVQDAHWPGWREALALARSTQPRQVLPGHGPVGGPAQIDGVLRYLAQLEQRTAELLREGVALSDVADRTDLPEFAQWDQYDTIHRRNASLVFLRQERALLQQP